MEFNGTFLATIISFVVFVLLMNKILYAPILKIMEERREYIDKNYKAVEENSIKIKKLTEKKNEKLTKAREEAKEKYLETVEEFKTQKAEIVMEAQEIARDELEKSRIELQNLSNEVKEGLKGSMTDLANDIVEKVIGYRSEVQGFDNKTVDEILYN